MGELENIMPSKRIQSHTWLHLSETSTRVKHTETKSRLVVAYCCGMGCKANVYGVSFWGHENVQKCTVVMVAHICECTKALNCTFWMVTTVWYMNYINYIIKTIKKWMSQETEEYLKIMIDTVRGSRNKLKDS